MLLVMLMWRIDSGTTRVQMTTADGGPPLVSAPAGPTAKRGPTFECERARAPDDLLICSDPALAALDVEMNRVFGMVRATWAFSDPAPLLEEQDRWLTARQMRCLGGVRPATMSDAARDAANACLRDEFVQRMEQLLQMGSVARRWTGSAGPTRS